MADIVPHLRLEYYDKVITTEALNVVSTDIYKDGIVFKNKIGAYAQFKEQ